MNNPSADISFRVQDDMGWITFNKADAKVNVLNFTVMETLEGLLDEIGKNVAIKALVFLSAKKDVFIAGADIKEIDGIVDPKLGIEKSQAGQRIFNKIEDLGIPTIAVIDGVCLGGGCELALACRFRIATFNEKVSIGLPEVRLGILPGFGGTYRLPKLIGLSEAIKMMLTGKTLSSKEAYKTGLVQGVFAAQKLESELPSILNSFIKDGRWPTGGQPSKKNLQKLFLDRTFLGHVLVFRSAKRSVMESNKGFYPAPLKIIDVLKNAQGAGRTKALLLESKAFGDLVNTDVSKNLIKLFYLTEKYKKISFPGAQDLKLPVIKHCAVLGAGIMGGGIAQLLSDKGFWVRLKDLNYDALLKGLKAARKIYDQLCKKRKLKLSQADFKMAHISTSLDYSGFRNVDLVIEAVVEDLGIKQKVFKELSLKVSPRTILCSNTSALSVTEMAKETSDPTKVVGLHFFNPVHRMPLIEVIYTPLSSPETVQSALQFARSLGKTPILVKDSCGFLVNRILLAYINEAGHLLEKGGDVSRLDHLMTRFGMPMGPFALSDEVGLDVGSKVLHILEQGFGSRFKPANIFIKISEKKWLGKKSSIGFYLYGKRRVPNPQIAGLLPSCRLNTLSDEQCRNRMLYVMVNEAARCLEEGIVDGADAVDIGMIMGTGFPPFLGGLLGFAQKEGLEKIVKELEGFAANDKNERFKPCAYLINLVKDNRKFYP